MDCVSVWEISKGTGGSGKVEGGMELLDVIPGEELLAGVSAEDVTAGGAMDRGTGEVEITEMTLGVIILGCEGEDDDWTVLKEENGKVDSTK